MLYNMITIDVPFVDHCTRISRTIPAHLEDSDNENVLIVVNIR